MNTNHELLDLAREIAREEGLSLEVALEAAALVLDIVAECAASWDAVAKELRDAELLAFAQEWDGRVAELQALVA